MTQAIKALKADTLKVAPLQSLCGPRILTVTVGWPAGKGLAKPQGLSETVRQGAGIEVRAD